MTLRITRGKGFHMTFPNGWTASIQFGPGNYCEHYNDVFDTTLTKMIESYDAEVWAWSEHNKKQYPEDGPAGYYNTIQVLKFLNKVSKFEKVK